MALYSKTLLITECCTLGSFPERLHMLQDYDVIKQDGCQCKDEAIVLSICIKCYRLETSIILTVSDLVIN